MKNYKEILNQITTLFFDVDGVLTNGTIIIHPSGEKIRTLNTKDAYALQLAVKRGLNICIITGGNSAPLKEALSGLGITNIFLCASYKLEVFKNFINENNLIAEDCLYMGDDLPDYQVMQLVGLPVCPADAANEIKEICLYVSPNKGGNGCVRDVIEQVLKAQNKWLDKDSFVW
ncbi:MAG: HAD hydrolase family protein [Bacteroidia bacterium]|nr:HAD hydrolase family protein [Bacteroidia bacterium]